MGFISNIKSKSSSTPSSNQKQEKTQSSVDFRSNLRPASSSADNSAQSKGSDGIELPTARFSLPQGIDPDVLKLSIPPPLFSIEEKATEPLPPPKVVSPLPLLPPTKVAPPLPWKSSAPRPSESFSTPQAPSLPLPVPIIQPASFKSVERKIEVNDSLIASCRPENEDPSPLGPFKLTRFTIEAREDDPRLLLLQNSEGCQMMKGVEFGGDISKVVSFLGTTHNGKSTLIRSLMGFDPRRNEGGGPKVPETSGVADYRPTSSDTNGFFDPTGFQNPELPLVDSGIWYFDVEGDGSGDILPVESEEILSHGIDEQDYFDWRRDAVDKFIPRMSYLVSDVIVFVTTENFASAHCRTRIVEGTLLNAQKGIDNSEIPSLILVSNKATDQECWDVQQTTEAFLKAHDGRRAMRDNFRSVQCINIPQLTSSNFPTQIEKLKSLISSAVTTQIKTKNQRGTLFSTSVWNSLFKCLMAQFNNNYNIKMGQIVNQIISECRSPLAGSVVNFFNYSNCLGGFDHFDKSRILSMKMAAVIYASEYLQTKDLLGDTIADSRYNTENEDFKGDIDSMINDIDKSEPCNSSFSKSKGKEYKCCHIKSNHPKEHRSGEKVGLIDRVKNVFGKSSISSWSEKDSKGFLPNPQSNFSLKEARSEFWNTFKRFTLESDDQLQLSQKNVVKLMRDLSSQAAEWGNPGSLVPHGVCFNCWKSGCALVGPLSPKHGTNFRCIHTRCQDCHDLLPDQYVNNEFSGEYYCLSICPICPNVKDNHVVYQSRR
eukprot:TRINITY_DN5930_c0_g1_i1.p1 TRINITY_DN5930_c0_g1~~TRINITY_DN5930_c0_g1_i1.p1  ORF type:complete len:769 (-),score=155.18 TRINITY_DN5930_c0_g1_i1:41-2347(-)